MRRCGDKTPEDREYTVSTIDRLENGSAVNWAVMMIEIRKRREMAGCVMKSKEYGSMSERLNPIRHRDPGNGGIKPVKWDVVSLAAFSRSHSSSLFTHFPHEY